MFQCIVVTNLFLIPVKNALEAAIADDAIKLAHVWRELHKDRMCYIIGRTMTCAQFYRLACGVLAQGKLLPSPK